jgi:DNA-binding NtrC family response regulator
VLTPDDVLRLPGPLVAESPAAAGTTDLLAAGPLADQLRALKIRLIQEALSRAGGNQRVAAELLGMHRQSLTRMIRDIRLQASDPSLAPDEGAGEAAARRTTSATRTRVARES